LPSTKRPSALYKQYNETVNYFEQTGLKNASLIIETANKQFSSGLINYLEWIMLVNQATTVKNDYLDAVHRLNESIIQLNYYHN
jgi:cobalt-zinc-cadmium resistance protein CzcA